jgi:Domain of unknown function (DUF1735)
MKIFNLKTALPVLFFTGAIFSSCKKADNAVDPLGDKGQKTISFQTYGGTGVNFGNSGLAYSPTSTSEKVELNLLFSTDKVAEQDISVVVEVDPAIVTTYNQTQTDPLKKYLVLNASAYKFPSQTVMIKAGQSLSETFEVEFNPSQIDGSKNYMLPLVIKSIKGAAADVKAAAGTGTAYFHFIGNPLAGTYTVVGTRYNCTVTGDQGYSGGPIPANFATAAIPASKFLAPVTPTITTTYVANLGAGTDRDYFFTIDPAVTTTGSISVDLTPSFANGISNIRFLTKTYDPVAKKITLLWTYNNQPGGVGNDRIISEVMTKQ